MAGSTDKVTKDVTTGIGTLSFPNIMKPHKNDKGEDVYDLQFIFPKTDKETARALLRAIKTVGESRWGANWKSVRSPLRDGDKEANQFTEDGKTTKGKKYPERLGCYFINAKSTRPVAVVDRQRVPITNESDIYGGCKVKVSLQFYAYNSNGNQGIGAGINGVQKIADGEPFGAGAPAVESMFDLLDEDDIDDEDIDLDDDDVEEEVEETPAPKKRAAKKAPAKKAAAKKAVKVEVEDDEDDLLEEDDDDDDMFDDLDDED